MAGEESHDGAAEGSRCRHRRRRFGRDNNPGSQSDDRGDLISALPDEILQRILSFIPTKYAIGTTILSKRWRYIWSQTPLLNLDGYGLSASSIDKTLASYAAAKIRNFHLRLDVRDQDMASHVDRWIQIATSRHVEELSLDIRLLPEVKYDLPDFLYINSTISRLSLWLRFFDMAPSGAVSWTSLRSLSLSYCILTDESIARVLSGCPMLERLTLCSCEGIQCLDLSESVRLRSLDVVGIIDTSLAPREIVAPHIHTWWLAGSIPCCWLVDVSSLTEAEVEICFCQEDIGSYLIDGLLAMVLEMLKQLQNAEKLTFGMTFLQILSLAELLGFPFPTLKNKVFTFETMITKSVLPGIARLLKNSPNLKELTALTGSCICIPDEYLDDYLYDEDLNLDECCRSRHGIFPHLLDTLEALENKATKPKLAASFMEFLLQNTWALEKMIFRPAQNVVTSEFEELLEMARTLSSPRSGDSSGPSIFLKRLKSNVLFSV